MGIEFRTSPTYAIDNLLQSYKKIKILTFGYINDEMSRPDGSDSRVIRLLPISMEQSQQTYLKLTNT